MRTQISTVHLDTYLAPDRIGASTPIPITHREVMEKLDHVPAISRHSKKVSSSAISPRKSHKLEERLSPSHHKKEKKVQSVISNTKVLGDNLIWCEDCQDHPPNFTFTHMEDFTLKVESSQIAGAGQGVINRGSTISVGVLFGPYQGKFYTVEQFIPLVTACSEWTFG